MKLLYFAPVPWDSYEQRPHYVVRYFLNRAGSSVLWVDPYPTRLPAARDLKRLTSTALDPLPRPPGLDVLSVTSLPFEPLAAGRWLNAKLIWPSVIARFSAFAAGGELAIGVGRPSDLARRALEELRPAWSFFDAMDDFPEFYVGRARDQQARLEKQIVRRVRAVYASSSALVAKMARLGAQAELVGNAFDMTALSAVAERTRRTVVGFTGCIGSWFDWSLVLDIAKAMPDIEVRLIGPCVLEPPETPSRNITLLPMCHQDEAVTKMADFDIGLIPFVRSPLTSGVDPIKYYAYRAAGLPVVSTSFGEMAGRLNEPDTYVVSNTNDAVTAVRTALERPVDLEAVRRFRAAHDWSSRFRSAGLFDAPASRSKSPVAAS